MTARILKDPNSQGVCCGDKEIYWPGGEPGSNRSAAVESEAGFGQVISACTLSEFSRVTACLCALHGTLLLAFSELYGSSTVQSSSSAVSPVDTFNTMVCCPKVRGLAWPVFGPKVQHRPERIRIRNCWARAHGCSFDSSSSFANKQKQSYQVFSR